MAGLHARRHLETFARATIHLVGKKNLLIGYRLLLGSLGLSAIVTEIATLVARGRFVPANFFSFFTIESNLFAVVIFMMSAMAASSKPGRFIALLRGANTLNMILVGVIFSLLLSGLKNVEFTAVPWDNIVLHYIMPVVVALDWFIDLPRVQVTFKRALVWLVFPVSYVVYSLIRGHIVNWYPYPFLNPSQHGYLGVAITSIVLMLGATGLIWVLARCTKRDVAKRT